MKVSKEILNLVPYKPGKPISETQREFGLSQVFKLASNENPLGSSPMALKAIQAHLKELHYYPDPTHYDLLEKVSSFWKIPKNQLSFGNGSDEIIDLLCRIYCEPGDSILTSEAAFAAYEVSGNASRTQVQKTKLTADYKMDLQAMSQHFFAHPEQKIRLIFIANPNNPTGTYVNKDEVDLFLQKLGNRDDVLVVFDEAYTEFVRAQDYPVAFDLFRKYKNVCVLRTFSKIFGLAGIRVGALVAPVEVIEIFNRVRKPFNVNSLAQIAVIAAMQDYEFIKNSQQLAWSGLDYFYQELKALKLPFIESQGNFVLFDTLRDASKVDQALLRRGIILRPVKNYGFPRHLRMSVGIENENKAAMDALHEVLKEIPIDGKSNHN
ncbi:MAG: histidinol-phosphate transaminase [Bdellovibrionota bacterium]